MSSIFDQAYDEMALDEVIYRLPGELAVSAFKRRVKTAEDILEVLKVREAKDAAYEYSVKEHINNIISNMPIEDLTKVDEKYHPRMFKWLNNANITRLKEYGVDYVNTKLLFNITQPDEVSVWESLLNKELNASEVNKAHVARIADKIDGDYFGSIIDKLLSDARPEVKASILKISGPNVKKITEQQYLVALKAYSKCSPPTTTDVIRVLDWNLMMQLKAHERFTVIKYYISNMPEFKKIKAFYNSPTLDEFTQAIFPMSIQFNEEFNKILEQYKRITEEEPPQEEEDLDLQKEDPTIQQPISQPLVSPVVPTPIKIDQLNASDWYFQDDYLDEDEIDTFTFIRKSSWDTDNKHDEELSETEIHFINTVVQQAGIGKCIMPCVYQCNGNDVEKAVVYLKAQGFVKKKCIKK